MNCVVDTFYDRSLKLWTTLIKDEEGNQLVEAGYGMNRYESSDDAFYKLQILSIEQKIIYVTAIQNRNN